MARKTKEQAAKTRDRILDAAIQVFYQQGVSQARLEDVARAAKVTRGAIYWHFDNKLSLFKALHERVHISFMQQMLDELKIESGRPLEQLENLCIERLVELEQDDKRRQTLTLFLLKCDYSGELSAFFDQQAQKKKQALQVFRRFFLKALELKQLPEQADVNLLALSFYCYLSGIVSEYLRAPGKLKLKRQAKPLMRQYFNSLR